MQSIGSRLSIKKLKISICETVLLSNRNPWQIIGKKKICALNNVLFQLINSTTASQFLSILLYYNWKTLLSLFFSHWSIILHWVNKYAVVAPRCVLFSMCRLVSRFAFRLFQQCTKEHWERIKIKGKFLWLSLSFLFASSNGQ